jgi:hypothetical protein
VGLVAIAIQPLSFTSVGATQLVPPAAVALAMVAVETHRLSSRAAADSHDLARRSAIPRLLTL